MDDAGHAVNLAHPATRIISLAPDLTEILFEIGAGNQIVGVMYGSDYPAPAKKIPIVAKYNSLNLEAILALQPDLIVVWDQTYFYHVLTKLHIPIYVSHTEKLLDIPKTMIRLGLLTGHDIKANEAANRFTTQYLNLKNKYQKQSKISVFYQVWSQPLITLTGKSWVSDMISLCGATHLFADLKGVAPEINLEALLVANPDIIIAAEKNDRWKTHWQAWSHIRAVKNQHLFTLDPDLISRASPRLLQAAEKMCTDIDSVRTTLAF